jgi:hypothetical protein
VTSANSEPANKTTHQTLESWVGLQLPLTALRVPLTHRVHPISIYPQINLRIILSYCALNILLLFSANSWLYHYIARRVLFCVVIVIGPFLIIFSSDAFSYYFFTDLSVEKTSIFRQSAKNNFLFPLKKSWSSPIFYLIKTMNLYMCKINWYSRQDRKSMKVIRPMRILNQNCNKFNNRTTA